MNLTRQFPTPTAVIDPNAAPESLEAKQPYVDHGTRVYDKDRYFSREFMEREWECLWTNCWLIAGVESDIPEVGDYFLLRIRHESIIVTRTEQGLKAFYNVCAHRGSRLLLAERGHARRFVCPFHSWRYANTGELLAITDRETFRDEVVCHQPGLVEVHCDTLAGIVFIHMGDEAPPLREAVGLPEGYLEAYHIDRMHVVRHVQTEWLANWKVGVEAFYESYHLHQVHPETRDVMADRDVQYDLYPNGASRMIVPIGRPTPRRRDQESVNDVLKAMLADVGIDPQTFQGTARDVRPAIQRAKRARAEALGLDYSSLTDNQLTDSWATGIFPNVQIGCHPEGVFLMRFLPHPTDPERFYYDTMTLYRPTGEAKSMAPAWMGIPDGTDLSGKTRPPTEHLGLQGGNALGLVLEQDSELLPVVQDGMRSRAFRGQLWGEQELRLRHFHAELDRYLDAPG
jgi:phenylpropionate dioxygenase-like ring-hydroxylating dioxygenase large terminal subunit